MKVVIRYQSGGNWTDANFSERTGWEEGDEVVVSTDQLKKLAKTYDLGITSSGRFTYLWIGQKDCLCDRRP